MSANSSPAVQIENPYGYTPSLAMGIAFLVIFSLSTLTHLVQSIHARRIWWYSAVLCGLMEILGWSGRIWSSQNIYREEGFLMQICCLIIGPFWISLFVYVLMGEIIQLVNPRVSIVSGRVFKISFVIIDFVSGMIQGIGGGIAGSAENDLTQLNLGSNVMLAGIVFQLVCMVCFVGYASFWIYRARLELRLADKKIRQQIVGIFVASFAIIVRGIYRTIELSPAAGGFEGYIAQTEFFTLLDGIPVAASLYALNLFHPSRLIPELNGTSAKTYNIEQGDVTPHGSFAEAKASFV